jgi:hypothetical protein
MKTENRRGAEEQRGKGAEERGRHRFSFSPFLLFTFSLLLCFPAFGQRQDIRRGGGTGGGGGGATNGIQQLNGNGTNTTLRAPTLTGVITTPLLTPSRVALIGSATELTNHPTVTAVMLDKITNLTSDAQAQLTDLGTNVTARIATQGGAGNNTSLTNPIARLGATVAGNLTVDSNSTVSGFNWVKGLQTNESDFYMIKNSTTGGSIMRMQSFSSGSYFPSFLLLDTARGTKAAPSGVLANDRLPELDFTGAQNDGSSYRVGFGIHPQAMTDFTGSSAETLVRFFIGRNAAGGGKLTWSWTPYGSTNDGLLVVKSNVVFEGSQTNLINLGVGGTMIVNGNVWFQQNQTNDGFIHASAITSGGSFKGLGFDNAFTFELGVGGVMTVSNVLRAPFLSANTIPLLGVSSELTNAARRFYYETNSAPMLSNLVASAASGDTVELGKGMFHIGTQTILIPVGVTLRGQGIDRTIISGTVSAATNSIVVPSSTNTIEDLTISAGNRSAYLQYPIGVASFKGHAAITNLVLRRVKLDGESDALFITHPDYCSGLIEDCEFISKFDSCNLLGSTFTGTPWPGQEWTIQRTRIIADVKGVTEPASVANNGATPIKLQHSRVVFLNCEVIATNANTSLCLSDWGDSNKAIIIGGRWEAAGTNAARIIEANIPSQQEFFISGASITHSNSSVNDRAALRFMPYEASHLSAGGIKLTGGQAASALLRLNSTTNLDTVTVGAGLTFDGTTLNTAGGAGEANTASSLGNGLHLFSDKSGLDLRFNTISNLNNTIQIVSNNNTFHFAATNIGSAQITDGAVTFLDMADMATDRLIGRDTGGTGPPELISIGGGLEFTGGGVIQRGALTGDVTSSAGSGATTIANDAVTDPKLRNSAALSVIGRSVNSIGDPADIATSADGEVLRRSGTTLGFGAVSLATPAAITGNLPLANGGTGKSLSDPGGHRLLGWDDTDNDIRFWSLQASTLSYNAATDTLELDADLVDLADGSLTGTKVGFSDPDNVWTATDVESALAEMNNSINAGVPNGTGAKVHWSQLLGVPAGFADNTDDGGAGGTNNPVQAVGFLILTNGVNHGWVHLNENTNVWVDWKGTNVIIVSPSNTFSVFYSNAPAAGSPDQTIELQVRNTNSAAAFFPWPGPNGTSVILLAAPSTNFFYLRFDGTNFFTLSGQTLTTGRNDTNVFNVEPTLWSATLKGTNLVDGNIGYIEQYPTGTGGANTNFTLLVNTAASYVINGFTNVSFRALYGGTLGITYTFSIEITNGSGTTRTLEFSQITNNWVWSYAQGGAAPTTMTNSERIVIEGKLRGTNITASYAYFPWP